ncbi:DUF6196 family protein [Streptomyces sp. NPDC003006]
MPRARVGLLGVYESQNVRTAEFVICGSNRARGGIYDYWGCPIDLLDQAVAVVRTLRDS